MVKVGDDVSFKIGSLTVEGEVVEHVGKTQHRIKITKRPKGFPVGMKFATMTTSSLNVDPVLGAMPSKSKTKTTAKKSTKKGKVPPGHHRMPDGSIMKDSDMPKGKKTYKK
tara:strand:- start:755 stop:1087 length:333 start_codon:yes stop_codon:yes gene_type:complete